MTYWQVAAGSFSRDYSDRFLRHGLAFVGGDWQCEIMRQVQPMDTVVLKRGMSQIVAVGTVVERLGAYRGEGDKEWLRDFDGWDLPAWCNVDWNVPKAPIEIGGLTRSTIQRIKKPEIIQAANEVLATRARFDVLETEPTTTEPITDAELIGHLISFGLRPLAAEELTQALQRIRLLAAFYLKRDWTLTKEHEARTFLVVPLLLALGWAEQRIQVEVPVSGVGRADIVCFRHPIERADQHADCSMIIETKGLAQGLNYAPEQAHRYAELFPSCEVVLVTNGYCYKAFKRLANGEFSLSPSAYLNLMRPRNRYPLDPINVGGAIETIQMLAFR